MDRETVSQFIAKCLVGASTLMLAGVLALAPSDRAQAAPAVVESRIADTGIAARLAEREAGKAAETESAQAESAAEEEPEDYSRIGIANADSFVFVREAPDRSSAYVAKMYYGHACVILEQAGDWYYVCSGETFGYVFGEYLTIGDAALCEASKYDVAVIDAATPLYADENADTATETLLDAGSEWPVIDAGMWAEGYIYVEGPEGEGFVPLDAIHGERRYAVALTREREEAERAARIAAAQQSGQTVVDYAMQFLGNPYVYGGTSLTNGCDCSGFVMQVYAYFGVGMSHSSAAQRSVGYAVSASEILPGDIVCYYGHVGIYIGNGQIIHAATPSQGIITSSMYIMSPVAIRRVF